jgi:hypothetical protein
VYSKIKLSLWIVYMLRVCLLPQFPQIQGPIQQWVKGAGAPYPRRHHGNLTEAPFRLEEEEDVGEEGRRGLEMDEGIINSP